jgi:hypothetical protein
MQPYLVQASINLTGFYIIYCIGLALALTQIACLIIYKESNYGFKALLTTFIMLMYVGMFRNDQNDLAFFLNNDFVMIPTFLLLIFAAIFLIVIILFIIKYKIEKFKLNKIKKQEEKERKERLSKIR